MAFYKYYIFLDANGNPINLTYERQNLSESMRIDFDNLPSNIAPFELLEREEVGLFQVLVSQDEFYVKESDGVVRNRRNIRDMTAEEKAAKIEEGRNAKHSEVPDSWVYNETLCIWEPPTGYPADFSADKYWWNETDQAWEESPLLTDADGNQYYDPRSIKPE